MSRSTGAWLKLYAHLQFFCRITRVLQVLTLQFQQGKRRYSAYSCLKFVCSFQVLDSIAIHF